MQVSEHLTVHTGAFSFEDLKKIDRKEMGPSVPIELYRAIRLIGMNEGLPMGGKGTTLTIGRKMGESLPVNTIEELFALFIELKIGIPEVISRDDHLMRVAVEDCFCKGLPVVEEKMVCDLEGAIMEGALTRILDKKVFVREVKCNVHGDERCEYEIRY